MTPKYKSPFIGAIVWAILAVGGTITNVQDRTITGSYRGKPYKLIYAPYPTDEQVGGVMDALRVIGAYQQVEERAA